MKNSEINEIEMLEKKLSKNFNVYKEFKNSANNENYFNNLYYNAISKKEEKQNRRVLSVNPAMGYAMMLFVVSLISFQFIRLNNEVSLNNDFYYFSESSFWIEEEIILPDFNSDADIELDYESYLSSDFSIIEETYLNYDIYRLAENNFDNIYNKLKNKKIL